MKLKTLIHVPVKLDGFKSQGQVHAGPTTELELTTLGVIVRTERNLYGGGTAPITVIIGLSQVIAALPVDEPAAEAVAPKRTRRTKDELPDVPVTGPELNTGDK